MRTIQVMCVDDSPDILTVLQALLSQAPDLHCVGALETAKDLKTAAREREADVVIVDLRIPGCDCLGEIRELKRSGARTEAIVFSGDGDSETVERSLEAGASACVRKDSDPFELLRTIREVARKLDS